MSRGCGLIRAASSLTPCALMPQPGLPLVTGGEITNPNGVPIQVTYTVDGVTVFDGSVAANSTAAIPYTFNDGNTHVAQFTWSVNGQTGRVDLGSFGPCGAADPTGTASCTGGTITNPNPFPLQVTYTVDGGTIYSGSVPANTIDFPVAYTYNDGAFHTAGLTWSGNNESGSLDLGSFGPCGAVPPLGTASCSGGSITNPNAFPVSIVYIIDGNTTVFNGQVAANATIAIPYIYNDPAVHTAQFTWSGNGASGTVALGSFGPCSPGSVTGTASCVGGSVTNNFASPINVTYLLDNQVQFSGSVDANNTLPIPYTLDDGQTHTAELTWSGNAGSGTINLGSFGPCGAADPTGMASCSGGTVTNPNPFPIDVVYTVDGNTLFNGPVAANTTQSINYAFTDTTLHSAQFTWSGNNDSGSVDLGSFGPCGDQEPTGTAGCNGGTVTNPNPFPIQVVYTVDGNIVFNGPVAAGATVDVIYTFSDGVIHSAQFTWSGNNSSGSVDLGRFGPCAAQQPTGTAGCNGGSVTNPNPFPIDIEFIVDGQVIFTGQVPANSTLQIAYQFEDTEKHKAWFTWSGNGASGTVDLGRFGPCAAIISQYQSFIGPVTAMVSNPTREPGKEYFDGPRSVMYNVEYPDETGRAEIVFRFNGQELSGIVSSLFNNGGFRQVESQADGRAITTLDPGVTKLIGYRFEVERTRIFHTRSADMRWIHPLDQPFEYKPHFQLELHGPPAGEDWLIYGDYTQTVRYDTAGVTTVDLTYRQPGPVAIYPSRSSDALTWTTVGAVTFPISQTQPVDYRFAETGLYHYRVLDSAGQVIAPVSDSPQVTFDAEPGQTYYPQLVYPATSLFVALLDDMQFQHPTHWTLPIDGGREHLFEFHLDYHRLPDPDLGNPAVRGDIVIEELYLLNATTSIAQSYPYSRHDGVLPGVTLVGLPDASMVAFCAQPGVHAVVYWGGWENEAYYDAGRSLIFDPVLYDAWTPEQRADCLDAAERVNQRLAREGLRTDHTFRHHGERSQGYQMTRLNIWSPYNLASMRPPHIGHFLKRGTTLPFYNAPEDRLFWGWDLDTGTLRANIDPATLQQHLTALGPVEYVDQTDLHPPAGLR